MRKVIALLVLAALVWAAMWLATLVSHITGWLLLVSLLTVPTSLLYFMYTLARFGTSTPVFREYHTRFATAEEAEAHEKEVARQVQLKRKKRILDMIRRIDRQLNG